MFMPLPFMFEKPLGLRDTLPFLHRQLYGLKESFYKNLLSWGYDFLSTPALEYENTIGKASLIPDKELFRLFDREGHTVILRPDMTAPIARVAASSLKNDPLPLRIGYMTSLFRAQQFEGGRPSEFEQAGAELIGDPTPYADAEILALMLQSLNLSGVKKVKVAIGHAGFVNTLLDEVIKDEALSKELHQMLFQKNDVGFRQLVHSLNLTAEVKERLDTFLQTRQFDQKQTVDQITRLLPGLKGSAIAEEFSSYFSALESYGVRDFIDIDLTLVNHMSYYTGIVFEAYGEGHMFPLANGGRYDTLLDQFHRPAPATGFGIRLDRLLEAVDELTLNKDSEKQLILFDEASVDRAAKLATEKRKRGESVILQKKEGLQEDQREIFYAQFKKRIDLT